MKFPNPFKAKQPAPLAPAADRVILGDPEGRPGVLHIWRGRTREHLSGDVAFEAVNLGRPGHAGVRLGTFGDN